MRTTIIVWILVFSSSLLAQELPVDTKLRTGVLDNGMSYYIFPNKKPEKKADMFIVSKVGSMQEQDHQHGLAHFAEHMAFNGTKNFPGKALTNFTDRHGLGFGSGKLNAYTTYYKTVYNIYEVPTDKPEVLDSCLLILHDWSSYVLFEQEELDKERGVIAEEYRTRMEMYARANLEMVKAVFPGTRYERRTVIGDLDVILNHQRDDIVSLYNEWYRPDLQAIVVVGDFDVEEIEAKIKAQFGRIPKRKGPERVVYPIPDNKEPLVYIAGSQNAKNVEITYSYKRLNDTNANSLRSYRKQLTLGLLTQVLRERFSNVKKENSDVVTNLQLYTEQAFKPVKLYRFAVSTNDAKIKEGATLLAKEIARLKQYGVSMDELSYAKDVSISYCKNLKSTAGQNISRVYANMLVAHYVDQRPFMDENYKIDLDIELINQITLNEVNYLANELFCDGNEIITVMGPDVEYPSEEDILKIFNDKYQLKAYDFKYQKKDLLGKLPTPSTIMKEKEIDFGVTQLTLSNGVNVYLKKNDYDKNIITISAISPGGLNRVATEDLLSAKFVNVAASSGGIGNLNRDEVRQYNSLNNIQVGFGLGEFEETLSARCTGDNFNLTLKSLYAVLTSANGNEQNFKNQLNTTRETYKHQSTNSVLGDSISAIFNNHPRNVNLNYDAFEAVSFERAFNVYLERFRNIGELDIIIVGDFEITQLKESICQYLALIPTYKEDKKTVDYQLEMPAPVKKDFIIDMEVPKTTFWGAFVKQGQFNYKKGVYYNVFKDIFSERCRKILREEMGGTYGVDVRGERSERIDPYERYDIVVQYDTDPERKEEMKKATYAIFNQLISEGPIEKEIRHVIDKMDNHVQSLKGKPYYDQMYIKQVILNKQKGLLNDNFLKIYHDLSIKKCQKVWQNMFTNMNVYEVVMSGE